MLSDKSKKRISIRFYILFLFFLSLIIFICIYLVILYNINKYSRQIYENNSIVTLRKFPYPYRAAMSICSDIDGTTTLEEFLEIQKFLNTKEMTKMGIGIGLEIGNSFLMYAPKSCSISYFSNNQDVRDILSKFIKAGYLDFLHSYGQKNDFTRNDAIKAINELNNKQLKVNVWVDHAKTIDNLGDDCTFGLGDHQNTKNYHSDITLNYGIKFFWLGRVTMITGQSVPISLGTYLDIFDSQYPFHSIINMSKEFIKNVFAILGNKKYTMHEKNELVKITKLDDGRKIYEFIRFDNYWKGVATGATSKRLSYVISKRTLNNLKKVNGFMIVYTHLGYNSDCSQWICYETQDALRNLANEYETGNIYVTTTSKLLTYYINCKYLNWSYENKDNELIIHIHNIQDPVFGIYIPTIQDLQGITFYIPDNKKILLFLGKNQIESFQQNNPDYTGRKSITIPLTFLKYPLTS